MIKATIPSYRIVDFKAELKSSCKKMHVEYELIVGEKYIIFEYFEPNPPVDTFNRKISVWGYDVEIIIPEIEKMTETGYEYLGCIKDDGIVSVHPNENTDFDLSSMEQIKSFPCDRCGKKVNRNVIHVFRKGGNVTVYGSTCAKTKFGIDVSALSEKFSTLVLSFGKDSGWEDYDHSGKYSSYIQSDMFASMSYYEIASHGFTSASKVYRDGYGTSTNDYVVSEYNEVITGDNTAIKEFKYNIENIEFDYAKFMVWADKYANTLNDGDFKFNIGNALELMQEGYVHPRTTGIVVYLVFKFWDAVTNSADSTNVKWNTDYSEFECKKRYRDIKMVVINECIFEGNYGVTHIYTFRGVDDNRKYKWFSTKEISTDGELLVTGTVKDFEDHPVYGKVIIITRCAVKEV